MDTKITPWKPTSSDRSRGPLWLTVYPEDDGWTWDVRFKDGEYPETDEEGFLLETGHTPTLEEAQKRADEWVTEFINAIWRPREV